MIVNQFVLIYLTISVFAMAAGIMSIIQGIVCIKQWHFRNCYEKRYVLEKRIYFLMAVFGPLLLWRILAIPLWFGTLKSLIPSIPGAMCIYGVVAASPVLLGGASTGQLVLPFLLIIWFMWHLFDQNDPVQPLLRSEVNFAVWIGTVIVFITGLEIGALASLKPRIVHCCTSLFDLPRIYISADRFMGHHSVPLAVSGMIIVAAVAGWLQISSWRPAKNRITAWLISIAAVGGLFAAVFLIIEKLAPQILKLPLHHCPFCLLEHSIPTLLAFIAWYGTLIFQAGAAWAVRISGFEGDKLITRIKEKGSWSVGLQAVALLWFIYNAA